LRLHLTASHRLQGRLLARSFVVRDELVICNTTAFSGSLLKILGFDSEASLCQKIPFHQRNRQALVPMAAAVPWPFQIAARWGMASIGQSAHRPR
jgi:hypothetical protein